METMFRVRVRWLGSGLGSRLRVKPWSNGHASSRKLITWGYLRHRLARPCVHLR